MATVEELVDWVYDELPLGRIASWKSISYFMGRLVLRGHTTPHLEIGLLHGGTAIMAALIKKHICGRGKVIAIDPLDGYYPPYALHPDKVTNSEGSIITREHIDQACQVPICRETVDTNIKHFEVEDYITIYQTFSYPWPRELEDARFGTAYIDGDHYRLGPLVDWINVHSRMMPNGIVWLDDCNHHCPDVQSVAEIIKRTPGWDVEGLEQGHCFAVRKK